MSTVIIFYDAKCKHCRNFGYKPITKKDGTKSKKKQAYCKLFNDNKTLKSKACDKINL